MPGKSGKLFGTIFAVYNSELFSTIDPQPILHIIIYYSILNYDVLDILCILFL